jgi:hypothetical protein
VSVGDERVDPFHSLPGMWGEDRVFVDTRDYPQTNEGLPPHRVCMQQGPEAQDMQEPYTSEEERELGKAVVETVEGIRAKGDNWREGRLLKRGLEVMAWK